MQSGGVAQPSVTQTQQCMIPSPQQPVLNPKQFQQQHQPPPQSTNPTENRTLWIGDLQYWMEENYIFQCFAQTNEVANVKLIRNKQTSQSEGYGFIEFVTQDGAQRALQTFNGTLMPNIEQNFRLNWAAGEKRKDDIPEYTIFVGDLASDVTDNVLQETFRQHYASVKGAKVVIDKLTGRAKGYGFVKFGDESEQQRAMREMNGQMCSSRQMRIGAAANRSNLNGQQLQKVSYQRSESDPNNTTIFVGGLGPDVSEETLKQVFGQFGDIIHVKIPVGKRCGFVQFRERSCSEQALQVLNGTQLEGQSIRLNWGRYPSNRQYASAGAAQLPVYPNTWNNGYYGNGNGYGAYGYAPPAPHMYYYSGYSQIISNLSPSSNANFYTQLPRSIKSDS